MRTRFGWIVKLCCKSSQGIDEFRSEGGAVNESSNAVRVRIGGCWDVDIFKEMIVGVAANNYVNSRIEQHGIPR
jgi:hypothetical protein